MDFEFTREQKAIQKAAQQFADGEFHREYALECDRNHRFPTELYKKACEVGLVGVHFPEEYGGQGYGVLENLLVIEALCRKDPGLGIALHLRSFGAEMILRFGNEDQKKAILPGVAAGEVITGAAFTEPDHGSDVSDVNTTAVREGDEFVINGVKTFITNGLDAHHLSVLCKTDPNVSPTYRGLSLILVDSHKPGYSAVDLGAKMGQRMMATTEVTLKDVRVPVTHLVGKENRGFYQMLEFFDETRLGIAAQALGGAQAAYDRAVRHVKQRKQFGRRLADFQVTQHKIADMATKIEMAQLLTYKAAWTYDHKGANPMLTSMAKYHAARAATEVAEETIQLFGGYGYFEDNEVERIYRDVRVLEIYEGTKEIQKNTIASHILKSDRSLSGIADGVTSAK